MFRLRFPESQVARWAERYSYMEDDGLREKLRPAVLARGSAKGKDLAALVPGEASAHRFECRLERERDGWRIVEATWRAVGLVDALAGPPEP